MTDVKLKPGWICKDQNSLWWTDLKPSFINNFDSEINAWEGRGCWCAMRNNCIVDPWPDKPDGGPECILEVK